MTGPWGGGQEGGGAAVGRVATTHVIAAARPRWNIMHMMQQAPDPGDAQA